MIVQSHLLASRLRSFAPFFKINFCNQLLFAAKHGENVSAKMPACKKIVRSLSVRTSLQDVRSIHAQSRIKTF